MQYYIYIDFNLNVLEIKKIYVFEVLSSVNIDEKMVMEVVCFVEKMGYKIKIICFFMLGWMNCYFEFVGMWIK